MKKADIDHANRTACNRDTPTWGKINYKNNQEKTFDLSTITKPLEIFPSQIQIPRQSTSNSDFQRKIKNSPKPTSFQSIPNHIFPPPLWPDWKQLRARARSKGISSRGDSPQTKPLNEFLRSPSPGSDLHFNRGFTRHSCRQGARKGFTSVGTSELPRGSYLVRARLSAVCPAQGSNFSRECALLITFFAVGRIVGLTCSKSNSWREWRGLCVGVSIDWIYKNITELCRICCFAVRILRDSTTVHSEFLVDSKYGSIIRSYVK